jgi:hypothetical protein
MSLQGKIGIWLDDERDPRTEEWRELARSQSRGADRILWAESVEEFKVEIERVLANEGATLHAVMFDIYLGYDQPSGHDALAWLEEQVVSRDIPRFHPSCHSHAERSERFKLRAGFYRLKAHWKAR